MSNVDIQEIMKVQFELQKAMGFPGATEFCMGEDGDTQALPFSDTNYSEQGAKEMLLAAMVECSEALGEFSWKCWKPDGYKEVDKQAMATELTDIIQFVANAAIYLGLSGSDLAYALQNKWQLNFKRIHMGETTRERI